MQITDILASMGGLQSMAKELGISESQAQSGAAALAPAVPGGMKKQAQSGDMEGLVACCTPISPAASSTVCG